MSGIPQTLQKLAVPIDGLTPYEQNPRKGDLDLLRSSLEHHGQYRPIVVRARSNEILAGNHTWLAAKALGWKEIAVTFVDCDDDEAARIVLVDNRAADQGRYDEGVLADLLSSLSDPTVGTGYNQDTLDRLIGETALPEADFQQLPDAGAAADRVLETEAREAQRRAEREDLERFGSEDDEDPEVTLQRHDDEESERLAQEADFPHGESPAPAAAESTVVDGRRPREDGTVGREVGRAGDDARELRALGPALQPVEGGVPQGTHTRKPVDLIRYQKHTFHLEPEEIEQFKDAVDRYVDVSGTLYGFFLWVLDHHHLEPEPEDPFGDGEEPQ